MIDLFGKFSYKFFYNLSISLVQNISMLDNLIEAINSIRYRCTRVIIDREERYALR